MTYDTLKIAIGADKVGIITMNRPEVLNAMNTQMGLDLLDAFNGVLRRAQPGSAASC